MYLKPNQNIIDVCLQELGSLDNLLLLHSENGCDELPALIDPGTEILVPAAENKIIIVGILKSINPATGNDDLIEEIAPGGIGYMGIGINFKVS